MDIDFHYHATYAAARFAGFSPEDALVIATAAQMIDENGRHVLKKKSTNATTGIRGLRDDFEIREEAHGSPIHTFRVQMTFQGIGDIGTSSDDTLASIWPVYHFLPGNFAPSHLREVEQVTLEDAHRDGPPVFRSPLWSQRQLKSGQNGTVQAKFRWLCRPHSPMAIGLINNCTDLFHDRTSQIYKQRAQLHMIGVTMHVFIDTWAHQDFVGPASGGINTRRGAPRIAFASSESFRTLPTTKKAGVPHSNNLGARLEPSEWKKTAPAIGTENSNFYVGHGQVGHWPDHSSLIWAYSPGWSSEEIVRINPVHYFDAFVHMVYAMLCIRNNRQYVPFEVNERSLNKLYVLSSNAGDDGVALTADRLRWINRLIQKKRDPWGVGDDPELPSQISDPWDKMIFVYGREWQRTFREDLFPDEEITTDWVPGASSWVHEVLEAFQHNQSISVRSDADWLTLRQFQSLDFVKFNIAAKHHYRYVKQQLLAFGESLLGSWADGAAYADDLARIENVTDIRTVEPWKIKIINVLSKRQRETKKRAVSEGLTILISEIEAVANARQAVRILRQAINPTGLEKGKTSEDVWTYGMEVTKKGELKHGQTYETIQSLIEEMEQTNGFSSMSGYLALPTVSEWERRSSVTFSRRSSDSRLVAIDKALAATHNALKKSGFSERSEAWNHALDVVRCCEAWKSNEGREKKREAAVDWLQRSTALWLENDQDSHPEE